MNIFLRRLFVGLLCLALYSGAGWLPLAGGGGGGGGCSQYTALAARMDGGQNVTATQNMICGMVTDGTYALMDTFYVFASNSSANALLSWVSATFNASIFQGSCTFTANAGYTGDASSCVITTAYNPNIGATNFALNSASQGVCVLDSRTTPNSQVAIGLDNAYIVPLFASGNANMELNGSAFANVASSGNAQGLLMSSRTSSSNFTAYQNGSSLGTIGGSSNHIPGNANMYILAQNPVGVPIDYSGDQVAAAFVGGGLTSGQANAIYSRLHAYLTAIGAPSGC